MDITGGGVGVARFLKLIICTNLSCYCSPRTLFFSLGEIINMATAEFMEGEGGGEWRYGFYIVDVV